MKCFISHVLIKHLIKWLFSLKCHFTLCHPFIHFTPVHREDNLILYNFGGKKKRLIWFWSILEDKREDSLISFIYWRKTRSSQKWNAGYQVKIKQKYVLQAIFIFVFRAPVGSNGSHSILRRAQVMKTNMWSTKSN